MLAGRPGAGGPRGAAGRSRPAARGWRRCLRDGSAWPLLTNMDEWKEDLGRVVVEPR
ncbi:MAG: hypothetical protein IPH72_23935 [Sandaracinaceae bacterium]|nr:hypothetical protein [Sandaracinaceae bacterium]